MKMKLLIFIDTLKPLIDGVSVFIDNILPLLAKKYDITIIAPHYSNETYENAILITFPLYKIINFDYGQAHINRKIIKNEVKKCDIIFSHESASPLSASFIALKYARIYKKPFFTSHDFRKICLRSQKISLKHGNFTFPNKFRL